MINRTNTPAPQLGSFAPHREVRAVPATYLFRAAVVHLRSRMANENSLERTCKSLYRNDPVTPLLLKSTASPATTTDPAWAGPLARRVVSSLLQEIVSISAAADLLVRAMRLNFDRAQSIQLPGRQLAVPSDAGWVSEGAAIPVHDYMTNMLTLRPHKLASITTYTAELARASNVEEVTRGLITEDVALQLDATLFSTTAETVVNPGGILAGVAAISSANGTDRRENMTQDIENLVAALAANKGGSQPTFITDPAHAAAMKAALSPKFDYPILASTALTNGTLICVEPRSLASTVVDADADFATSDASVLHYEDTTPTDIVAGGTPATPTKSLFQTDGVCVEADRRRNRVDDACPARCLDASCKLVRHDRSREAPRDARLRR
jgi:hypothetical protein